MRKLRELKNESEFYFFKEMKNLTESCALIVIKLPKIILMALHLQENFPFILEMKFRRKYSLFK